MPGTLHSALVLLRDESPQLTTLALCLGGFKSSRFSHEVFLYRKSVMSKINLEAVCPVTEFVYS